MDLLNSLIAYWKFNESSGNAADSLGTYLATNNGGITYEAGKIDNGAKFGASKYFSTALTAIQEGDFTISTRWKPADTNDQILIGGSTNTWVGFRYADPAGQMALYVMGNKVANQLDSVSVGTWYNYILTRSGNVYSLYKNGNTTPLLQATVSGSAYTGNLEISGAINGIASTTGMLDETGIWTRALTEAERTAIYNSGNGVTYPFSVAFTPKIMFF